MAWTCTACAVDVALDTESCPKCGSTKASWTMVADKTRNFAIDLKRWEAWRGEGAEPVPPDHPDVQPETMVLAPIEEAVALPKATAAALAKDGKVPAPRDLLVLRCFPKSDTAPVAVVSVPLAQQPQRDVEVTTRDPALHDGHFELLFLFVHGPGDAPQVPGVHVIDVTDPDAPQGHAPQVQVVGFKKKKPRELPVRAQVVRAPRFVFSR